MESNHHDMNLFDLIAAFARSIVGWIRAFFRLLGSSLRVAIWRWYVSLPLIVIGAAGALYWSRPDNLIYKVGAVVKLNGPKYDDLREAWQPLQFALPGNLNEEQSLPHLLGISPEEAAPLRDFVCFHVIDCKHDSIADGVDFRNKHDLSDTSTVVMPDHVYLQFRTKRPQQAQQIGNSILAYLNTNKTLRSEYTAFVGILQREAEFCRTQTEKLDSLTTSFYFEQGTGQQIQHHRWASALVVGEREINLLHPEILELIQYSKKVEHELSTAAAPVVLKSDFCIDPRPVNGRWKCLAIGIVCGYILGCIAAWAVEERRRIVLWLKRK